MLIGSGGGAGSCVILECAVLSRVLKADVLDMRVRVEVGGGGGRESGMFGLFSSALSGCRGACELSFGVRVAGACCDDSSGGGEVQVFVSMCDGVSVCVCVFPPRPLHLPCKLPLHA